MKLLSIVDWFGRRRRGRKRALQIRQAPHARLCLEALEERRLLACNVISGRVFHDANNDGLFSPGETPIAGSTQELRNAANVVVATAISAADGTYRFDVDRTIDTTPAAVARTASFSNTATDWTQVRSVAPFDPVSGRLTAVDISGTGSITSTIKVENTSLSSPATVSATVSGTLTLTGPGLSAFFITPNTNAGNYFAGTYDGTLDFTGTSGHDFGSQTANSANSVRLTDANALALYSGTNAVSLTMSATATSRATGGGNLVSSVTASAGGTLAVTYNYVPSNCLRQGGYAIVQTSQPAGFLDGKESSSGVVVANSAGKDAIAVTLGSSDLLNNNFGELQPASVSGFVFADPNNNGNKEQGENGIGGVTLTLTGNSDLGPLTGTATTNPDGSYSFNNLRPGTYAVTEAQAAGYLDGKDALGSVGGTLGSDRIASILVTSGAALSNYNFGEILPARISGLVYLDTNDSGAWDSGEAGIGGVPIALTGTDDLGSSVNLSQLTGSNGSYHFDNLRPGNYAVLETQPTEYQDGRETLGSTGGTLGNDQLTGISLAAGAVAGNYNFGELVRPGLTGFIYSDSFARTQVVFSRPGDLLILSKLQFLASPGQPSLDPVTLTRVIYVDGLYRALLQRPADVAGVVHWVMLLQAGMSRAEVVRAIWVSAEHRGLQVDAFYRAFFHRSADPQGRAYWVNRMLAGTTESDVASQLLASGEYQASHPDAVSFLGGLYADVLGRFADSSGLTFWTQALQGGTSREVVARAFITSTEAYLGILHSDYLMFLSRPFSQGDEAFWLPRLQNNQETPQSLGIAVLAADEFFALAAAASRT